MILHYIKRWLPVLLAGLWFPWLAMAQEISSLSPSSLPLGSYVTGLYQIEADDGSGLYLKEQADTLAVATLDTDDSAFYFWVVENVYTDKFQLYSATQQGKPLAIDPGGTGEFIQDNEEATTKLLFRMYSEGAQRTATHEAQGITAIGYITTETLSSGYGDTDCRCNFLLAGGGRFKLYNTGVSAQNYRPIVFEKTNDANTLGTIETDTVNQVTRITQTSDSYGLPHNFVSSNFFIRGFGEDDFKITVSADTNGYIGFLEYTDQHYTREVYNGARTKIGLKIVNGAVSLVYLLGEQPLPSGSLDGEVPTGFVADSVFTLGFKNQDSLVVSQGGVTHTLERAAPAELFFNRSVTQSARMMVSLVEGEVELSYTPKNYLINSEDDLGTDDGSELVSTHAYMPYNAGNSLVNTFLWQETQWKVRYVDGIGTVTDTVFSPFYNSSTEFSGISAKFDLSGNYEGGEDFSTTEGWELIKADLGYNADGSPRNQAPNHPYVMLYDRVGGTLRIFVYTNNEGEANQLTVALSNFGGTPTSQQGYVPKLWGSLQQFVSLDQVAQSEYSKALPFYGGSGRSWYFADFVMEYDPCIAFFESTINLLVYKTTQGTLTMVGRFEGGSLPAGTPEYSNWQNQRENFLLGVMDNNFGSLANTLGDITFNQYEDYDLLEFKDSIGGILTGAEIEDWEKEIAKIEWEAQQTIGEATIAEGAATIVAGAAQIAEAIPIVETGAKVVGGIATMAAGASQIASGTAELKLANANKIYYDNIKDKVREDDQAISMSVPPPRPQAVFGELALQGTLSIQTTLIPESYIATPGGSDSDLAPEWYVNGSRGSAPLYNRPVGKFTLLEQPEFGVGVAYSENAGYSAYLKIKEKPYFAHNNSVLGKIDDMLTISIHVQTLNSLGAAVYNAAGTGYTNLFGVADSDALPGEMEISDLIDWDQIDTNIAELTNPSAQDIEDKLPDWIKVSYEVWSITLTNLKGRNLRRVIASGDQYYEGADSFEYTTSTTSFTSQLSQVAKSLAESGFSGYDFSDNATFGGTYNFYHSQYDESGDDFYTAMNTYCSALATAQSAKNAEAANDVKGEEVTEAPEVEDVAVVQPGLRVYPNPAQYEVNFRLVSEASGKAETTLYDLTGRALISTTDSLNGRDVLQGRINIAPLPAGIYILEVKLPDGSSVNKKIIKK